MTAVIYARYSSDNQREESIEGQIRECTAYAEKNGITFDDAFYKFTHSRAYDALFDFETGIWREGMPGNAETDRQRKTVDAC